MLFLQREPIFVTSCLLPTKPFPRGVNSFFPGSGVSKKGSTVFFPGECREVGTVAWSSL